jgi:hypothetical protein
MNILKHWINFANSAFCLATSGGRLIPDLCHCPFFQRVKQHRGLPQHYSCGDHKSTTDPEDGPVTADLTTQLAPRFEFVSFFEISIPNEDVGFGTKSLPL